MKTNRIQGFTLVEILVALAVFSGLMMTLFSSFNAFTVSSRTIREYEKKIKDTGMGLAIIRSDLEQIFALQPPQFMLPDKEDADSQEKFRFSSVIDQVDGEAFSRLSFASLTPVRFSHRGLAPRGITRLTYYVAAADGRFNLHRSDTPVFLAEKEEAPCADPIVYKNIRGFELIFFDAQGDEYDHWESRDDEFEFQLPSRVSMTITLASDTGERQIGTQIRLPVERQMNQ